jgi:excinuclease UvrABC nuclease subunit
VSDLAGFSARLKLPRIPEGSGIILIEDEQGQILQVVMSNNVRRRIGELLDSQGTICVHGPKVYDAQQDGQRIYVRWKLTGEYKDEKVRLVEDLHPLWA